MTFLKAGTTENGRDVVEVWVETEEEETVVEVEGVELAALEDVLTKSAEVGTADAEGVVLGDAGGALLAGGASETGAALLTGGACDEGTFDSGAGEGELLGSGVGEGGLLGSGVGEGGLLGSGTDEGGLLESGTAAAEVCGMFMVMPAEVQKSWANLRRAVHNELA